MEDLDANQIGMLQNVFNTFDEDKKGYVDTELVEDILDMLGVEADEDTVAELTLEFDPEITGKLYFKEFCSLAARFLVEEDLEQVKAELRQAFLLYDKERQGFITTEVLKEIFSELDDKLSNEDLDEIIDEVDADGSGTVDFDEFLAVMTG